MTSLKQRSRGRAGAGRPDLALPEMLGRHLDLLAGQLQPELRGLVRRLEEELVVVRAVLRRLLECEQLVGAQVPLVVACTLARQDRLELVREPGLLLPGHALSILRACPTCSQTPRRNGPGTALRWPCACGRARWTSSSGRSTCSAKARRSGARSRKTGSARRSSSARPGAGRPRSPGSSRRPPAPSSRSCPRSRPRSRTSAACWPARASAWARTATGRSCSWTRSTGSTRRSRMRSCPRSRRASSP